MKTSIYLNPVMADTGNRIVEMLNHLTPSGTPVLQPVWLPGHHASAISFYQQDTLENRVDSELLDQMTASTILPDKQGSSSEPTEEALPKTLKELAQQAHLPYVELETANVDKEAFELLELDFIKTNHIIPVRVKNNKLILATCDPTNIFIFDEVSLKTHLPLQLWVCESALIDRIIEEIHQTPQEDPYHLDDIISDIQENDVELIDNETEDISDLEKEAAESPIIKLVNYIIFQAVAEKASDIHIEPGEKKMKVRFRVDGMLFENMSPPINTHSAVVSRIKIMSNLDIAERRLPQDGRMRAIVHGRDVDMRVSTLPSSYGEKVVIRILDVGSTQLKLADMGMEEDTQTILDHQIQQPHGIILVTGPTGSGKSTTLYSCLSSMDLQHLNISTVEDPVEFQLEGITQVQVHEGIGMTFGAALRSLLRQDPDVIMVGEIRDPETARIAVQASLTGHLVLSTLHTNDAPSSITRLINIGVEPFLIAASVNAVLAQRLVRRICPHCKTAYTPGPEHQAFMELNGLNASNMSTGAGCDKCRNTGFSGRIGLYELLAIDDSYRDIISQSPTVTQLRRLCKERGMITLREDGFRKIEAGITTIDEVMRVTESTI